jgi:hypothetical protein
MLEGSHLNSKEFRVTPIRSRGHPLFLSGDDRLLSLIALSNKPESCCQSLPLGKGVTFGESTASEVTERKHLASCLSVRMLESSSDGE